MFLSEDFASSFPMIWTVELPRDHSHRRGQRKPLGRWDRGRLPETDLEIPTKLAALKVLGIDYWKR